MMGIFRFAFKFLAFALLYSELVASRHAQHFKHEAIEKLRRQQSQPVAGGPPGAVASATATTQQILTYVTPSPGASPVAVTSQSQIVASYVPQFTLCELPPIEFFPTTLAPSARPTTAPYHNYSISIPSGSGTCTTIYSSTDTMVCATVLDGIRPSTLSRPATRRSPSLASTAMFLQLLQQLATSLTPTPPL